MSEEIKRVGIPVMVGGFYVLSDSPVFLSDHNGFSLDDINERIAFLKKLESDDIHGFGLAKNIELELLEKFVERHKFVVGHQEFIKRQYFQKRVKSYYMEFLHKDIDFDLLPFSEINWSAVATQYAQNNRMRDYRLGDLSLITKTDPDD